MPSISDPWLSRVSWVLLAVITSVALAQDADPAASLMLRMGNDHRAAANALILLLLAVVVLRLSLGALRHGGARSPVVLTSAGITLIGVAIAVSMLQGGTPRPVHPSALANAICLGGLACLGASVLLDQRRPDTPLSLLAWLNILVGIGALLTLLAAVARIAREQVLIGVPLTLVPILALFGVVAAQCHRGRRPLAGTGLRLLMALGSLALADLLIRSVIIQAQREYPLVIDLLWLGAILLIADAAMAAPQEQTAVPRAGHSTRTVAGVLLGVFATTLVIAFAPSGPGRWHAILPALIALTAATVSAVLAVRAARTAAEAERQFHTDSLTGLSNRQALLKNGPHDTAQALGLSAILMDLRRFKDVNDTLGHATGDQFLQLVATRLREAAPAGSRVARVGADQFCVVFEESDQDEVFEQAARLSELARTPITIDGLTVTPDWHVGMATGAESRADLIRQVDIALFRAKRSGRQTMFDTSLDTFSRARLESGEELRQAITTDQLELWYQPQLTLIDEQVTTVEALVRWRHPSKGMMAQSEFLEVARRLGLMAALTEITMRLACRQAGAWRAQGLDIKVSLNVGSAELLSPTLMGLLVDLIGYEGLPDRTITVEVTEESFLSDPDGAQAAIRRLDAAGVDVSVDDYGTGFSSLAYLRHLPLRELKIDRTFITQICDDPRSRTIVAATSALAHALDMRVVAEGVETADVLEALRDLRIDHAQGYYVARPMPPDETTLWLRNHRFTATDGITFPFANTLVLQPDDAPPIPAPRQAPYDQSAAETSPSGGS